MSHLANETELVSAARSGNQEAFGMLMGAYYQPVFRVALGMLHQREDAEDVLQQAMLKAYCNLDRFQGNSSFYTWMFRITTNEALMKIRGRHGEREVALDEPIESERGCVPREIEDWNHDPEESYGEGETNRILQDALAKLNPRLRAAFCLHYLEDLSMQEAAAKLGLSTEGTKSRVFRARSILRKRLRGTFGRQNCSRPKSRKPRAEPAASFETPAEVEQLLSTAA